MSINFLEFRNDDSGKAPIVVVIVVVITNKYSRLVIPCIESVGKKLMTLSPSPLSIRYVIVRYVM